MVSDCALEKYCRYGPRNTSSPSWVRMDGWKSRVSIVIGETHSRCRVWPCSTLALSKAYRITSNVTGSTSAERASCRARLGSIVSGSAGM